MVKKIISWIINAVSIALIILSVTVLMTVVFTKRGDAPNYFGYSVFRILTGSMEPALPVDTMCVVKLCGTEDINEGDVISFYTLEREIAGSVVTHRAVEIQTSADGKKSIVTKGDANPSADANPVTEEYLIGKVVWSSLFWGKLVRLASNPLIFAVFILVPLFAILISYLVTTIKTARQIEKEEIEQELQKILEEKNRQKEDTKQEEAAKPEESAKTEDEAGQEETTRQP